MALKSETLKKILTLKRDVNTTIDYTLYKYSDIQREWIICEGHLNYRYDHIKLFNISQFAIYYVVLARIPIEDNKKITAIYLYRNQKQKPSNFFQLNEYESVSDQCKKRTKSKYFLFELIGKDENDIEIFGAHDANERDRWMKFINQELNWTKEHFISNNLPTNYISPRRSWKEDSQKLESVDADVRSNYEPFTEKRHASLPISNNIFTLPHRPVPPIPQEKRLNSNDNKQIEIQRRHSLDNSQTTENVYLAAKELPPSLIIKEDDDDEDFNDKIEKFQSNLQIKTREEKKNLSTPLEDKLLTWDDIFYSNKLDDHANVLNKIGQIGTFLIRPQSNKNNRNDHDYTLSIYAFGGIIKYKILKFSNGKYSLVTDYSQPPFNNIPELCQYYINHPLPRSTLRDDLTKGPVGNLRLTWPYTYYLNSSNTF